MIPLIKEVVDYGWITEEQFFNMVGLAEITPGPIALNMATFVGTSHAGFFGGMFATLGVVLPSYIIICIVAAILAKFSENKYIKAALRGTMYVAIGLIISITITMTLQVSTTFSDSTSVNEIAFDLNNLKVMLFVLIGYFMMWIINKKKPSPIPIIFMSLTMGLVVNLGIIQTLIGLLTYLIILVTLRKKQ